MNYIYAGIFFIVFIIFLYTIFTYDPTPAWETQGKRDAINIYNLTGTIPKCPSVEHLIEQNFSTFYIKNYINGFKTGINELNNKYIDQTHEKNSI